MNSLGRLCSDLLTLLNACSCGALVIMLIPLGSKSFAQSPASNELIVHADSGKAIISRHIYGHFAEHLGRGIYGGLWVGEQSPIPNTHGVRNDVFNALKKIKIANIRWPGGCFADTYHWMDGIGPLNERKKIVNVHWGGVTEDNSFGTHEFLDLCERLGCEPVVCGNVGSGTVREMSEWVEYVNSDAVSPMTELRKKNGREKPWKLTFWDLGNEVWGCGGNMTPEYYSNELRRYSTFLRNYGNNTLYRVACGSYDTNYHWTDVIMKQWAETGSGGYMNGISLHYYTIAHDWNKKGSATEFTEEEYFSTVSKALLMDEIITKHSVIMDKYDPDKRIGLMVDEWGNWHDVEPGTNPGFLYQQNTMRDAISAALNLNIFNNHCSRVKMANIAQMVNVLQSLILTDNEKMVLTPTYHVYDLYKVHQDATLLPFELQTEEYELNGKKIPAVSASASRGADGTVHLSLVNVHPSKGITVSCVLKGVQANKISGMVLTSSKIQDHNTFEQPNTVVPREFTRFKKSGDRILIELPAKSVVVVEARD